MSKVFLPLAGLSLAALAAAAAAQQAPAPAATQAPTRVSILQTADGNFQRMDANKDGVLTKAEIDAAEARQRQTATQNLENAVRQRFNKLDTDKNGSVSYAEFRAGAPTIRTPAAPASTTLLQNRDGNKDGRITAAEFRAPIMVMVDRIDTNKDGILSPAETAAAQRQ